ncbi:hypothetical protein Vadar_016015 [Vaccinium darrowii]|uniref:Uncharacterized protein n=1 Tax=Vaccinium darrowii TaxID=229202 RepID=A0ACB7Z531_9ERIC|nr:hypothetical protein Vadar_016015 [Vaccinium darrowii]
MASSKVVAEYAKSGRSMCKTCNNKIDANALRLGAVTNRGYDMTTWHHLSCFPLDSESVSSAEAIDGFSSLKNDDQETLMKLLDESARTGEKAAIGDADAVKGTKERISKRSKVTKKDDDDLASSKVVAEYAKSGRSTCKKCDNKIDANTLRLGAVTRDKRGYDVTKWHHLSCFPMDSELVSSTEAIDGFSSLKNGDQETLTKLLDGSARPGEKAAIGDGDAVKGTKERISKRSKVAIGDEDAVKGTKERISKRSKLSAPTEGTELDVSFSISDIQSKYKDATLLPKWKAFRTVIFLEQDDGLQDSGKIAAFDFDGCLVNTSVKKIGPDAWSLMYPSIPEKLQSLYNEGYKLVIFTNESNIDRWKNKRQVAVDSKIGRLTNFIKLVKVPMQVFIACGIGKSGGQAEDPFRKPNPGMWHLMDQHFNSGVSIDMDQSFYVGDAAGREKDHSDADIKFAQAIGLKFYDPEEYFKV